MPITKTTGYKASDGQVYATVEEAQRAEVRSLLVHYTDIIGSNVSHGGDESIIKWVFDHSALLLEILTTGPRSRPSTRKKAGTTAPRRARARAATATEAANGFKAMREAVDPNDASPATVRRVCGPDAEVALETGR